ncbi:hypothetical protein ZIOFF_044663 [Zingiber officinale]|uniref:adenylate kinase n=1 Tax=Zingiber officinale TaxID=94328 RepID=A0A8J5FYX3_ZINOF|nr:hypothetical protein ZIOFF_044663 [Zingiber officinale]
MSRVGPIGGRSGGDRFSAGGAPAIFTRSPLFQNRAKRTEFERRGRRHVAGEMQRQRTAVSLDYTYNHFVSLRQSLVRSSISPRWRVEEKKRIGIEAHTLSYPLKDFIGFLISQSAVYEFDAENLMRSLFPLISLYATCTALGSCTFYFAIQNIALMETPINSSMIQDGNGAFPGDKKITVVFVLGGPGSGKGTQCSKIVENFGFTHLSAGDLLRAEIKSGSENGTMISNMIKEGKIVPSEVTVELLRKAILESGNNKFVIDGFPRNEENRVAFENVTKLEPEFILFFDCPEEEMEQRLLGRNQGRDDDNIETIRKRFGVFIESSLPVIEYYDQKGKVRKRFVLSVPLDWDGLSSLSAQYPSVSIDAMKPIDDVFEDVKAIFAPFLAKVRFEYG